jgi:hypothetical protein
MTYLHLQGKKIKTKLFSYYKYENIYKMAR